MENTRDRGVPQEVNEKLTLALVFVLILDFLGKLLFDPAGLF